MCIYIYTDMSKHWGISNIQEPVTVIYKNCRPRVIIPAELRIHDQQLSH